MSDDSYGRAHVVGAEAIEWAHQSAVECRSIPSVWPIVLQPIPLNGPSRVLLNVGRQLWLGPCCRCRSHRIGPPECCRMLVDTFGRAYCVAADTIEWALQSAVECRTTAMVGPMLSVLKPLNGPSRAWVNSVSKSSWQLVQRLATGLDRN